MIDATAAIVRAGDLLDEPPEYDPDDPNSQPRGVMVRAAEKVRMRYRFEGVRRNNAGRKFYVWLSERPLEGTGMFDERIQSKREFWFNAGIVVDD